MQAAPRVSDDPGQLRRCIRDLLALGALPAIWRGQDALHIVESLADALVGVLGLDFVYLSLPESLPETNNEVLHLATGRNSLRLAEVGAALAPWLRPDLRGLERIEIRRRGHARIGC